MEFPPRVVLVERALVGAFLTALVASAALESLSPLSWALRRGEPVSFWASLSEPDATWRYWGLYRPASRTVDLVYVPGASSEEEARALVEPHLPPLAAARSLSLPPSALPATGEDPAAAGARLEADARDPGRWRRLVGEARRLLREGGAGAALEGLLFAQELGRLPRGAVRPAWLPEGEARAAFLSRLLSPEAGAGPGEGPVTVEVLNAAGLDGLAAEATKVLRLGGADVVGIGNGEAPRRRTIVYDRTGRPENAALVRRLLGCPEARAVTRVDGRSLVDVTVLVGPDCAGRLNP